MKIARVRMDDHETYAVAEPENDRLIPAAGDPFAGLRPGGESVRLSEARLLAPVLPSKIVAVGLNYQDHADEQNAQLPDEPRLFIKPATAVIGPGEAIVYPEMSERVDYEAELAVVISRRARNVPPEEAQRHILGYTCGNDVTARDLQKKDRQWTRAKSFDTFAPLGPWIETDLDPSSCPVEARLNGEAKQSSNTGKMIFSVPFLVSFISRVMTLLPGDVILTGTPAGIGPMNRGDTIEITVGGIGTLKNRVV
ncbi:MAG: 2-hydroxyhepta-2,4-diene-1,7-dioate isomerase [Nitrospirae bacterium RBG_16_64_22]|nr:MAG: 2-hydroxyhepta-2,4-diene-1,7-dioate isomerase [Nitrospirae bacterium RBG_16_64_22]